MPVADGDPLFCGAMGAVTLFSQYRQVWPEVPDFVPHRDVERSRRIH